MNYWLTALLAGGLALPALAQKRDCAAFRTGTFRIEDEHGPTTHIVRTETRQTEIASGGELEPGGFTVQWIDDCNYELLPDADVLAAQPSMPRNARLKVRILSTTKNSYTFEAAFDFAPGRVYKGKAVREAAAPAAGDGQAH